MVQPNRFADVVCRQFHDLNAITVEEFGNTTLDYSVACCAKRPWCRAKVTPSGLHA
jgi:hypothetical protein